MKKGIIVISLVIVLLTLILATTTSEAYIPSETTTLSYVETNDKVQLQSLINTCQYRMKKAHEMAQSARILGYGEKHSIVTIAKEEWNTANEHYTIYSKKYNTIIENDRKAKWKVKEQQYPVAAYIWKYLSEYMGYNDYVCAGILGNIMTEVGGQTLNINYKAQSKSYYGMCQWSKGYKGVWGADLKGQCKFLADSIRYEFNTFGSKYQKGFKYNDFVNLKNERAAALAFAKCYERCGSGSYGIRQSNATKALQYFTN